MGAGRPGGSGLGGDQTQAGNHAPSACDRASGPGGPAAGGPNPQPGSGRSVAAVRLLCGACVGRAGPVATAEWPERGAGPRRRAPGKDRGSEGGPGSLLLFLLLGWVRDQPEPGTGRDRAGSRTCGAAELGADPDPSPPAERRAQGAPEPDKRAEVS